MDPLEKISFRSEETMEQPYHFKEKKPLDNISFRSDESMEQPYHFKEMNPLDNISFRSDESMEQPYHFKEKKPLDIISKNMDRPETPSCRSVTSNWSMEHPSHFKEMDLQHQKSKNMDRPETPSCRSETSNWSMEHPSHFKEMDLLRQKSKNMDRPETPSCRSETSNWSMEHPSHFKEMDLLRQKSKNMDRPETPSCRSETSNWSMEQPSHFKETDLLRQKSKKGNRMDPSKNMKRANSLEFTSKKGRRPGSPSRQSTKSTPSMQSKSSWGALSANFSYISMNTNPSSVEPQEHWQSLRDAVSKDVECDKCEGRKSKAYKSCMTCLASFCEMHIKDHYTIEAMRRHTLVEVTKNLEILQENIQQQLTIEKQRTEIWDLRNKVAVLQQTITELKLPDFICKGKTLISANVVLDSDTAHCALLISKEGKCVECGDKTTVSENVQRFDKSKSVLAKDGFGSGRHYWEVEVNRAFIIGVTRQSAQRKEKFTFCPRSGYWCLFCYRKSFTALEDSDKPLPVDAIPRVLGVCLDVDEKWVTFYNTETKAHIHTFRNMAFSDGEKIYPMFNIMEKSAKLVIKTVRDD